MYWKSTIKSSWDGLISIWPWNRFDLIIGPSARKSASLYKVSSKHIPYNVSLGLNFWLFHYHLHDEQFLKYSLIHKRSNTKLFSNTKWKIPCLCNQCRQQNKSLFLCLAPCQFETGSNSNHPLLDLACLVFHTFPFIKVLNLSALNDKLRTKDRNPSENGAIKIRIESLNF